MCEEFAGPHPAGTAGVHIEALAPVGPERTAWHVGYQDVAAIGRLVTTGELDVERVITLAGPGAARPRYLRTRIGASVAALVDGELAPGAQRVISGSVLDGRTAAGDVHGYLGRYHLQVAVVPEGTRARDVRLHRAGPRQVLAVRRRAGRVGPRAPLPLTTTTNGGVRAMVPIGAYERVMPIDILPTFLLRALITGDVERAEELGCAGAGRGGPRAVHVRLPRQGRVRAAAAPRARAAREGSTDEETALMRAFRAMLDRVGHHFEKGGRFERLLPAVGGGRHVLLHAGVGDADAARTCATRSTSSG